MQSLFRRASASLPMTSERDRASADAGSPGSLESLDSLQSSHSLESLDTLPSFAAATPAARFKSPAWRSFRSRQKAGAAGESGGSEHAKENAANGAAAATATAGRRRSTGLSMSSHAFSPKRLFKRAAAPSSSGTESRESDTEPSSPRDASAGAAPTTPFLPPSSVARQRTQLFSPLTPATATKVAVPAASELSLARNDVMRTLVNDDVMRTLVNEAIADMGELLHMVRSDHVTQTASGKDDVASDENTARKEDAEDPKDESIAASEERASEDLEYEPLPTDTVMEGRGAEDPKDELGATEETRHKEDAEDPKGDSIEAAEERASKDLEYHPLPTDTAMEGCGAEDPEDELGATEEEARILLSPLPPRHIPGVRDEVAECAAESTASAAKGDVAEDVRSEETVKEQGDGDDDHPCRCVWCPAPLLTLLRASPAIVSPPLLPASAPDGAGVVVDALRADLAAAREGARGVPAARRDALLAELRVVEQALDRITAL